MRWSPVKRIRPVLFGALALAAGLVVVVTASRWNDLAREYYLEKLRKNPGLLETMLHSTGAREEALLKFLERQEGKRLLLRLYLEEFLIGNQPVIPVHPATMEKINWNEVTCGYVCLQKEGYATGQFGSGSSGMSFACKAEDPGRRERILELLERIEGEALQLEGHDHVEFWVQPARDGKAELPPWPDPLREELEGASIPRAARHVCFFRIIRKAPGK